MLLELKWNRIIEDFAYEIRGLLDKYEDKKIYHILLLGDNRTGKSTFLNHITGIKFRHLPTEVDGVELTLMTFDDKLVQIWSVRSENDVIYKILENIQIIDGVLGFFDLTKKKTFHHLQDRVGELILAYGKLFPLILIGNKADGLKIEVSKEDVLLFAYELADCSCHRVPYAEMSALKDEGIEKTIGNLIDMIDCDLMAKCAERPAMLRSWCKVPQFYSFYDSEQKLEVKSE
jgi:GTPase SAR1 family protein